LEITGRYAAPLLGEDIEKNLITKALRIFAKASNTALDFKITLHKNLPIASGIGGGSADAAAALRLAGRLRGLHMDHPAVLEAARGLGSDGAVCFYNQPCMMRGAGEVIEPIAALPKTHMLLVNPNIPLATPPVFAARKGGFTPAGSFMPIPRTVQELVATLAARKNDLHAAAISLCPEIEDVLVALTATQGCLLARLSGSGATCFGLYATAAEAEAAAHSIYAYNQDWWVAMTGF
jgi:4-diphosphocytidyl-2-C-methyl-D-erythritol kinase